MIAVVWAASPLEKLNAAERCSGSMSSMLLQDSLVVEHFKANREGAEINFHKLRRAGVGWDESRRGNSRSEFFSESH